MSELTTEKIREVLTVAIEGQTFWIEEIHSKLPSGLCHKDFTEGKHSSPNSPACVMMATTEQCSITIIDDEGFEWELNLESIESGEAKIKEKAPHVWSLILEDQYDEGDADVFMQYCTLGEETYC